MAWFLRFGRLPTITAALLLLSLPIVAAQVAWQAYQHPGSGYRIDIPTRIFAFAGEFEGRRVYESADRRARLVTYSVENSAGRSLGAIAAELAAADAIDRVTYRRQGQSWVVLSGFYKPDAGEPKSIFYLKLMMSADRTRYAVFAVSYPPAAKRAFDPIVTRLERSFRPPS